MVGNAPTRGTGRCHIGLGEEVEYREFLLPDAISFEQAAPIFCAGYTVYSGMRIAQAQRHERVAVVGIGGLGHLAVQYAKAAGFPTIAISRSPDKDKFVRELGADEIVRDGKGLPDAGAAKAAVEDVLPVPPA